MKKINEIYKTINIDIDNFGIDGFSGKYYDKKNNKWLYFIFSYGSDWEHLSVSTPRKCPTWEQMCIMKDIFWNDDEVCMELHPAKENYVNTHNYCLHIWKPIKDTIPVPLRSMV